MRGSLLDDGWRSAILGASRNFLTRHLQNADHLDFGCSSRAQFQARQKKDKGGALSNTQQQICPIDEQKPWNLIRMYEVWILLIGCRYGMIEK